MMAVGYLIIAIPTPTPVPSMGLYLGLTCFGLLVIAFGNGLFKGNLQALVGQMYDVPSTQACATPVSRYSTCSLTSAVSSLRGLLSVCATGG